MEFRSNGKLEIVLKKGAAAAAFTLLAFAQIAEYVA